MTTWASYSRTETRVLTWSKTSIPGYWNWGRWDYTDYPVSGGFDRVFSNFYPYLPSTWPLIRQTIRNGYRPIRG